MEAPENIGYAKRKVPEKIVLQEPTKVRTEKLYDNDVEYIRTDAFIEKATKWLMDNIQNYTDDGMGEHSFVLVQDLKEDFKSI